MDEGAAAAARTKSYATSALLGGAGGLISAYGAHQANRANAKEAKKNRKFQERMSSTAHQREVKDLRKAGLNPILSANSGASAPSGAQATMTNEGESGVNSAKMSSLLNSEIQKNRAAAQQSSSTAQNQRAQAAVNWDASYLSAMRSDFFSQNPRLFQLEQLQNTSSTALHAARNIGGTMKFMNSLLKPFKKGK